MISGVLYALLAGLMWGLIFVGPLLVPEYPAMLQSMGRYLALGLIALPLAWLGRARLRQLSRHDWWTALGLTMMGNLIYYVCLASAIQRTGAPVSTMIIGTLPVVLPVFANLLYSQRDGKLPWRRLFPALICIAVGLICVNVAELRQGLPNFSPWRYGSGIALALGSVVCWAWYAGGSWLEFQPSAFCLLSTNSARSATTSKAVRLLPFLSSYCRLDRYPVTPIFCPFRKYLQINSAVCRQATKLIKSVLSRAPGRSIARVNEHTLILFWVCLSSGSAVSRPT